MVQSTKDKGDALEAQVHSLLAGFGRDVESEQLVGHKRVDLILRERHWSGVRTTAIECKNLDRSIRKSDLITIWADYEPLVARGDVDEVLVISAQPLSAAAAAYVRATRGLSAEDLASFSHSLLNTDSYLRDLVDEYHERSDGLPQYYVQPRSSAGWDLEDELIRWIHGEESSLDSTRPIAILGAYGIGKSSLATHLASTLATESLAKPSAPIPVLVRLGELAGSTDMAALLGRHFTHVHHMPGYSYSLFKTLMAQGRLVVILDGFDEMKLLVSWQEFKFNFREINHLVHLNSRVILLGRPTAFENDSEHQFALHGVRETRFGTTREPDWPDYQEVEMAMLRPEQAENLLQAYLTYRSGGTLPNADFAALTRRFNSDYLSDLAKRPVQVKMLADLLPTLNRRSGPIDLADIYDTFISQIIDDIYEREGSKAARLAYTTQQRRLFLQRFAYWHWTRPAGAMVTADQVPDDIILEVDPNAEDIDATRRDLVVGSPLERRAGERVRFAHQSFQEFLVAQEIVERYGKGEMSLSDIDLLMTFEVSDFVRLLLDRRARIRLSQDIREYRGVLSKRTAETLFLDEWVLDASINRQNFRLSPWETVALSIAIDSTSDVDLLSVYLDALERHIASLRSATDDDLMVTAFSVLRAPNDRSRTRMLDQLLSVMAGRLDVDERISRATVYSRGSIVWLGDGIVGDRRKGNVRIGLSSVTEGYRLKSGLVVPHFEGTSLMVRWRLPLVCEMLSRLSITTDGRVVTSGWRTLLGRRLAKVACVRDWVDDGNLSRHITLQSGFSLSTSGLAADLRSLGATWTRYIEEYVAGRSFDGRQSPRGGSPAPSITDQLEDEADRRFPPTPRHRD